MIWSSFWPWREQGVKKMNLKWVSPVNRKEKQTEHSDTHSETSQCCCIKYQHYWNVARSNQISGRELSVVWSCYNTNDNTNLYHGCSTTLNAAMKYDMMTFNEKKVSLLTFCYCVRGLKHFRLCCYTGIIHCRVFTVTLPHLTTLCSLIQQNVWIFPGSNLGTHWPIWGRTALI